MRYLLIIALCILFSSNKMAAQTQVEQCGTMMLLKKHRAEDPGLQERMRKSEISAQKWAAGQKKNSGTVITIPTIVHVLHNLTLPDQNIPDSVIHSQIEVLNEDFRRMNADAANTRAIFDSIAADVEVEFCLASADPAGNVITGINRVVTTQTGFEVFGAGIDDMKSSASGGADAWPRDQYLNIWVCNMTVFGASGSILGFAQFPGDDAATDGVVIQYNFMGRTNDPVQADSSLGRTATHEVGHWLGLRHTWADDQNIFTGIGTCDSSDRVDDTPNQKSASSYNCDMTINECSNEAPYWGTTDPPAMVENFMDYSSDSCSNMFSIGQKTRMWAFLNTDRLPLQSSVGCGVTSTSSVNTCLGNCTGEATVVVNVGTPPYTYTWSNGQSGSTSTATGLCAGIYTVQIIDALSASLADTVTVGEVDPLNVDVQTVDASCELCSDGSVTMSVTGGLSPYTYAWIDASGTVITPTSEANPGTYAALITDACGTQVVDSFTVGFYVSITQHPASSSLDFDVFPNPSTGIVVLRMQLHHQEVNIQVVNSLGKNVFESTIYKSTILDLTGIEPGAYFIRATSKNSTITKSLLLFK
ncbi:MAG: T9SS type A sorting domain-containing protein [Flavobacteriales bacterium]|nr:T9SS type A sorting domain-containing protein [Flavobacteriales bacterium]